MKSCPTLSDPMDCCPPGSSIHGICQARVLEWGAIAFSDNESLEFNKKKKVPVNISLLRASLVAHTVKSLPAMQETWVRSLGWEDLLEKEMATHSSVLAWRIPGTGEPVGLPSLGSHRVGHD